MKHYPMPLVVQHKEQRFWRELVEPLVYNDEQGVTIVVNKGFTTDLASIYVLRVFLPWVYALLSGYGDKAAVVHDYLYTLRGYYDNNAVHHPFTRKQADQMFFRALRAEGVAWWRASMFYLGVRAGGWVSWRSGE